MNPLAISAPPDTLVLVGLFRAANGHFASPRRAFGVLLGHRVSVPSLMLDSTFGESAFA